jgi:hypothetical protein
MVLLLGDTTRMILMRLVDIKILIQLAKIHMLELTIQMTRTRPVVMSTIPIAWLREDTSKIHMGWPLKATMTALGSIRCLLV